MVIEIRSFFICRISQVSVAKGPHTTKVRHTHAAIIDMNLVYKLIQIQQKRQHVRPCPLWRPRGRSMTLRWIKLIEEPLHREEIRCYRDRSNIDHSTIVRTADVQKYVALSGNELYSFHICAADRVKGRGVRWEGKTKPACRSRHGSAHQLILAVFESFKVDGILPCLWRCAANP